MAKGKAKTTLKCTKSGGRTKCCVKVKRTGKTIRCFYPRKR